MTTSSTSEYRVDEPAGFDDLNQQIKAKQAALAKLDSLSDDIDELCDDAAEMDESSRETVAQEMQQVQHEVIDLASIDDLETATERIAEIIAAPYRQAVKRVWETVCETVGIHNKLDEQTVGELNEALQRCEADELQNMVASFDRVLDRLTTLPEAAQTSIGRAITANPHRFLTNPESNLEPAVETVDGQAEELETVDEALDETTWGPDTPLAATSDYYGNSVDAIDADTVVEYVKTVDNRIADTKGLDLTTVARAHLAQALPVEEPAALEVVSEELSRYITKSASYKSMYVHASTLVDAVDDPSAHEASNVDGYVDEVDSFIQTPDGDKPANRLAEKLHLLSKAYTQWTETYRSWLTRDAVAIQAIDSHTELPVFNSPMGAIDLTAGEVTVEVVEEEPVKAVAAHEAYEGWVETLRGATTSDGEADIKILLALVRGESVSALDLDSEGFETLTGLLGDELTLQLTNSPEEV